MTAVGVRLGAALLGDAAEELELSGLTVWDPVCDGARHIEDARVLHDRFVGKWRRMFRPPPPRPGVTELLGLSCSDGAVLDLSRLRFAPRGLGRRPRLGWLASASCSEQKKAFDTLSGLARESWWRAAERDPGWEDVARLGDIIPDLGYSRALAELVMEGA